MSARTGAGAYAGLGRIDVLQVVDHAGHMQRVRRPVVSLQEVLAHRATEPIGEPQQILALVAPLVGQLARRCKALRASRMTERSRRSSRSPRLSMSSREAPSRTISGTTACSAPPRAGSSFLRPVRKCTQIWPTAPISPSTSMMARRALGPSSCQSETGGGAACRAKTPVTAARASSSSAPMTAAPTT